MNVRQLEIFRTVVAFGGVANAATNLGISQPAISRMIKHTEEKLGFQLFKRMGRRLYPTDEADTRLAQVVIVPKNSDDGQCKQHCSLAT